MRKKCGSKCFLGPSNETCFPICVKGTCQPNTKGIYAAYVRAREYGSKKMRTRAKGTGKGTHHRHTKKIYQSIAARAKKMLKKRGL